MTPAGVVITLAILAATFAGGWLLGDIVDDWQERKRDQRRFLAMTAAMRRITNGGGGGR